MMGYVGIECTESHCSVDQKIMEHHSILGFAIFESSMFLPVWSVIFALGFWKEPPRPSPKGMTLLVIYPTSGSNNPSDLRISGWIFSGKTGRNITRFWWENHHFSWEPPLGAHRSTARSWSGKVRPRCSAVGALCVWIPGGKGWQNLSRGSWESKNHRLWDNL